MAPLPRGRRGRVVTNPDHPLLVQACSIALRVLAHCRKPSWADLVSSLDAYEDEVLERISQLVLSDEQRDLLDRAARRGILGLLSRTSPAISVAVCNTCRLWVPVQSRVPAKCRATHGCGGTMVKASAAELQPIPLDATEPDKRAGVSAVDAPERGRARTDPGLSSSSGTR